MVDDSFNYLSISNDGICKYCGTGEIIKISLTQLAKVIVSIIPGCPDIMYICNNCKRFQFSERGILRKTVHKF